MEIYKYGKTVSIGKTYIIFESNSQGSIIYVPDTKAFSTNKTIKLFIYKYKTDYTTAVYGFTTFKERILFEDLISINGIGPKTAIGLLKEGIDAIVRMIINSDIEGLSSFPYLGNRSAKQIAFELSDKYAKMEDGTQSSNLVLPYAAKEPLKTLGFNTKQIEYAMKKLKPQSSIELLIEEAIKVISNAKFA